MVQADSSASQYIVTDNTGAILSTTVPGAMGDGSSVVRVPFAEVSGSRFIVQSNAEADQLTVDSTLGTFNLLVEIQGGDSFDELTVRGATDVSHFVRTSPGNDKHSGEIGFNESIVQYGGIENIVIDLGGGGGEDFVEIS